MLRERFICFCVFVKISYFRWINILNGRVCFLLPLKWNQTQNRLIRAFHKPWWLLLGGYTLYLLKTISVKAHIRCMMNNLGVNSVPLPETYLVHWTDTYTLASHFECINGQMIFNLKNFGYKEKKNAFFSSCLFAQFIETVHKCIEYYAQWNLIWTN